MANTCIAWIYEQRAFGHLSMANVLEALSCLHRGNDCGHKIHFKWVFIDNKRIVSFGIFLVSVAEVYGQMKFLADFTITAHIFHNKFA